MEKNNNKYHEEMAAEDIPLYLGYDLKNPNDLTKLQKNNDWVNEKREEEERKQQQRPAIIVAIITTVLTTLLTGFFSWLFKV